MSEYCFIEPVDVLHLRGNRLFGDPGSVGDTAAMPAPSVIAGALRSSILAGDGYDLAEFAAGRSPHPSLGTPAAPGSFVLNHLSLGQRTAAGAIAPLHPWPADLDIRLGTSNSEIRYLSAAKLSQGLLHSGAAQTCAVLQEGAERSKSTSGYWLTGTGWAHYLASEPLDIARDAVHSTALWQSESRVGIGLDTRSGRADDGKLFTSTAISFAPDVGFIAAVAGCSLPAHALLRLGGDGRAASLTKLPNFSPPTADYPAIARAGKCRLVLTSPGLFAAGWRLPGMTADGRWEFAGISGQLVSAVVPRAQVVSGWDLARWKPKAAARVAPTGSVYWLEHLVAEPAALRALVAAGLWLSPNEDPSRRAEGFNRCMLATF